MTTAIATTICDQHHHHLIPLARGMETMKSSRLYEPKSLFSKYEILIKYTLVPSIPLTIIAVLSANPNTWLSSEIHHFYIELFAVILAAVLAFSYLSRALTLDDKFSLFVGIGFLTSALIDLLHVIISYSSIDNPIFLKYFIPQTWFAGRIFLSAILVIAIVKYPTLSSLKDEEEQHEEAGRRVKLQNTLKVYLTVLAILAASAAISSLFLVFPASVLDNSPVHRPYELPSLVLFLIALFYFYKNKLYERTDVFYKGILGYLIVDIFSQIIMSYSAASFDTAHNVAHVLKDAGYFINIIALALSSIQYNARLRETNERLRQREELIRIQYEKLKEADNMKNEFINVAAHELRTPIQPILGLTQILQSKIKDTKQSELLDAIVRNARRLGRLTNDILDVTKIESQSLNLKKEQFNLKDVISNTIEDIVANIDFIKNIQQKNMIKLLYQPYDIFVEADKARITQVISNLLNNAIKFTEAKEKDGRAGTISISVKNIEAEALVSVTDTGIGIDPEIMPRLFSKFTSKSYQGTGLGLFISKSIIEAHGGRIWAENNKIIKDGRGQVEKGATFTFSLPLNEKQHEMKQEPQTIDLKERINRR
jgi:signal transduction histidine kinase